MLIEKLESQLEAEDLIKAELNGNLAAEWMAFTPAYDLLEAPRGLLRERAALFELFGFSCIVWGWIGRDASPADCGNDGDDNTETRAGRSSAVISLPFLNEINSK